MRFKRIDERKFQCILDENDFEEYDLNITDIVGQHSEKIQTFFTDLIEQAREETGVDLDGQILTIQMQPGEDDSVILTFTGQHDAGEVMSAVREDLMRHIKNKKTARPEEEDKAPQGPGATGGTSDGKRKESRAAGRDLTRDQAAGHRSRHTGKGPEEKIRGEEQESEPTIRVGKDRIPARRVNDYRALTLSSFSMFEDFASAVGKTWGIENALYKSDEGSYILLFRRTRASAEKYALFMLRLLDYGTLEVRLNDVRISQIKEHSKVLIAQNAVNAVRKYLC